MVDIIFTFSRFFENILERRPASNQSAARIAGEVARLRKFSMPPRIPPKPNPPEAATRQCPETLDAIRRAEISPHTNNGFNSAASRVEGRLPSTGIRTRAVEHCLTDNWWLTHCVQLQKVGN
jgi:hypothetical protein